MKKWGKILICLVVVAAIVGIVVFVINKNKGSSSSVKISSAEDLKDLVEKVYEKYEKPYPTIDTNEIDVTDETLVKSATGLENGDDFEYLVVSEPMISSQPYSFVLGKVKSGVNADKVAKEMIDNINPRKWICVSAEKVCATSSGDIVCLVMTGKEDTDKIFESFKEVVGKVGKEYTEDVEETVIDDSEFEVPSFSVPE